MEYLSVLFLTESNWSFVVENRKLNAMKHFFSTLIIIYIEFKKKFLLKLEQLIFCCCSQIMTVWKLILSSVRRNRACATVDIIICKPFFQRERERRERERERDFIIFLFYLLNMMIWYNIFSQHSDRSHMEVLS